MNPTRRQVRRILLRSFAGLIALGLGLFALAYLLFDRFGIDQLGLLTPRPARPNPVVLVETAGKSVPQYLTLDQNWPSGWELGGRQWFHHADQGTTIMPYRWL